jgi:hypothetical protein
VSAILPLSVQVCCIGHGRAFLNDNKPSHLARKLSDAFATAHFLFHSCGLTVAQNQRLHLMARGMLLGGAEEAAVLNTECHINMVFQRPSK